jgi:hypothetical protein
MNQTELYRRNATTYREKAASVEMEDVKTQFNAVADAWEDLAEKSWRLLKLREFLVGN